MDTVHVTERITAASLCISRNGKLLSRFLFLKGAPERNFFLISFFFRVWIVASYVKVLKFVVAAIETKNR